MNPQLMHGMADRVQLALIAAAALMATIYTLAAWWASWRWWTPPQPRPKARNSWKKRHPWQGGDL